MMRFGAAALAAAVTLSMSMSAPPAEAAKQPPAKAKSKPAVKKPARKPVAKKAATVAATAVAAAGATASYGATDPIQSFADEVATKRGLDPAWVVRQLAQARKLDTVQRLMMPPPAGTAKDWAAYRDRFVEPRRIAAGVAFWQANAAALQRAEAQYGVPAALIVGIVGVETYYGRMTGGFRVIDALATLSFDFPAGRRDRSAFFRSELEEFLVLCAREGTDPQATKGSFAGAIGLAQFMPGSINRHAVDFDGDGHVDMAGSASDAVGSIGNYLAQMGWQRGMPTHYAVAAPVDSSERALLLGPDIVPTFTAAQMAAHGALLDDAGRAHGGPLALVELQNGDKAPSYVAGTQNFYAVTRYNWSSYYALAVITLGQAVAAAR